MNKNFHHYTYNEYQDEILDNNLDITKLLIADNDLFFYEYHRKYPDLFFPRLREDASYEKPHRKLMTWYKGHFFSLMEKRMDSIERVNDQDKESFKEHFENNFIKMRFKLNELFNEFRKDDITSGIAESFRLKIFLIKILIEIMEKQDIKQEIGQPYTFIGSIINLFPAGSPIFFLEIYSRLYYHDLIFHFQKKLDYINKKSAIDLIEKPVKMMVPWKHQKEGFEKWLENNSNGILEMATATGKTYIGIMAIEYLYNIKKDAKVRIICHSRAILSQWRREIIDKLGLISYQSDDHTKPLNIGRMIIEFNTIQSVHKNPIEYKSDLMIVDEVHHAAAFKFSRALQTPTGMRLGLSATLDKIEQRKILSRYMGGIIYDYTLDKALEDGVISDFEWKVHVVELSYAESDNFRNISRDIKKKFEVIKNDHNSIRNIVPDGDHQIEDIHDFIRICEIARYKGIPLEKEWMDIQNMILTRRWIIHRSVPKLDKGMLLSKLYAKDKKVIIFTMDIESCERIYDEFKRSVKNTFIIHSKRNDNNEQINNFRRVDSGVLIGARMLDEGLDFPDAEVGINISSSKTKLQLIQRMGRILRKKDGKKAIFHHFISVPEKEDMISEEDDLNLLDDLSWVVDVAGKMRLKMDVVEVDEYIKDVRRSGERRISEKWKNNRLKELPGYGSFNMKNILSTFSYETLQRLIMNIYKLPEGIISNDEWYDLVKKASENDKETRVDVVGSWWILIIGRRDPDTIINIFRSYLNQNK